MPRKTVEKFHLGAMAASLQAQNDAMLLPLGSIDTVAALLPAADTEAARQRLAVQLREALGAIRQNFWPGGED